MWREDESRERERVRQRKKSVFVSVQDRHSNTLEQAVTHACIISRDLSFSSQMKSRAETG